ncbi:MAG: 50S ribosomal protein L18e [Methanobacteriota archaeon]
MRPLPRGKSNPALLALIQGLKKASAEKEAPIWRDIARRLEGPARNWAEVNVSKIDRVAAAGDTAIVPGKVLAAGTLTKKVDVAAFRFSADARAKVTAAGGKCMSIDELARTNPSGTNVRIVE